MALFKINPMYARAGAGLALIWTFCWLACGSAAAATLTTLYNFCSEPHCSDGDSPLGSLVMDPAGNLYGTTAAGGGSIDGGGGTVFKFSSSGIRTVILSDGEYPSGSLVMDGAGNLYGTTLFGGQFGAGTVFKLTPNGKGTKWAETTLYNFCRTFAHARCPSGSEPTGNLIIDGNGNLYGTTYLGGLSKDALCGWMGCGTVFEVTPDGQERVLYSFCKRAGCDDGANNDNFLMSTFSRTAGGLVMDSSGDLYGTTVLGGAHYYGTVFKLNPHGRETVVHSFQQLDGAYPFAGLGLGSDGTVYGATGLGGQSEGGTVFALVASPTEPQKRAVSVLYNFCAGAGCGPGGVGPVAPPITDAAGNLYGTTLDGGSNGSGTVFELTPNGAESVLYSFCQQSEPSECADGKLPHGGLVLSPAGDLYGTTSEGGLHNSGTIFKLSP
jgi:uncharacterized repeat protein (TIGR03803 family)